MFYLFLIFGAKIIYSGKYKAIKSLYLMITFAVKGLIL